MKQLNDFGMDLANDSVVICETTERYVVMIVHSERYFSGHM